MVMMLWSVIGGCAPVLVGGAPASFGDVPAPDASVRVTQVYEPYQVRGVHPDRVRHSLNRRSTFEDDGGTVWDAGTRWSFRWTWNYARGELCTLVAPTVTAEVTVTLPEWRARVRPEADIAVRFQAYRDALWLHELGHVERVRDYAERLVGALPETPPAPRCDDVASHATALGRQMMAQLRAAQEAYDRQTRHGFTQGASFP